ncbi:hypothetical protein MP228_011315 [Amoeboaphelidium protococcarum]|nr:hypothetical protein MP228_011315 [Amoeboaphelidium protococcarum]
MEEEVVISQHTDVHKQQYSVSNYQRALSALAGSCLTALLVNPLDVVRIRLQSSLKQSIQSEVQQPSTLLEQQQQRLQQQISTVQQMMKIARDEGVIKLWRGLGATLLMGIPATVIYMVGYENCRDLMNARLDASLQQYTPLLAGSFSRSVAAVCISPLELFRTRIQQSGHSTSSLAEITDEIRQMVRSQGRLSLWRGLSPTLWRDVPFSALYWYGYESIRSDLKQRYQLNHDDPGSEYKQIMADFVAGAASGSVAAYITTPFDVVKTRRQMHNGEGRSRMIPILRDIYRSKGWTGLMTGSGPRVLKVAPSCAIMIVTYEMGKRYFVQQQQQKQQRIRQQ